MQTITIPEQRHPRLIYGAAWSTPGKSGYYVRSGKSHVWVTAIERPDMAWGTQRQASESSDGTVVTIQDVRARLSEIQDSWEEIIAAATAGARLSSWSGQEAILIPHPTECGIEPQHGDPPACWGDTPAEVMTEITRRALKALAPGRSIDEGAVDEDGEYLILSRPAHRPRRDPVAARVKGSWRVHPRTLALIDAEAKRTGESGGQVLDRLAATLPPA